MKKVLIIVHKFQNQSSQRVKKFLKYLPKNNWELIILTSWDPLLMKQEKKSRSYRHKIIQSIEIPLWIIPAIFYKLGIDRRFKLLIPDNQIGWILPAVYKGLQIIKKEKISLIFTSCPSHSSAIVGYILKRITRLPLIVDFRDSWGFNPYVLYPVGLKKIDRLLCGIIFKRCDCITTVSQNISNDYFSAYPWIKENLILIPNGFDISDFNCSYRPFDKFTVTFTGSIYEGISHRSPHLFLKVVSRILKSEKIPKEEIKICFIGSECKALAKLIDDLDLNNVVLQTQRIPYPDALRYLFKSHLLLLIELSNALTGKVFEYLATGKPILAIIAKGELEQLVRKYSDYSYIITPSEGKAQKIEDTIVDAYQKWKEGKLEHQSNFKLKNFWDKYNREKLTQKLVKIFEKMINSSHF